jgi:O-antigen/teichoic acid export membrane protein
MSADASALARMRAMRPWFGASSVYVAERLLSSGVQFLVFLALARAYAPESLGVWTYSIAIMQLAAPFLAPGLEPVLVRALVREPKKRGELLGSAAALLGLTTLIAGALPLLYLALTQAGNATVMSIALLVAVSFAPNFMLVFEHHFLASNQPLPIVGSRLLALGLGAAAKIAGAANGLPLEQIALVLPIEAAVQTALLGWQHRRLHGGVRLRVDTRRVRALARAALPVMGGAAVVTLFFRINYVLMERLSNFEQIGLYTLAFSLLMLMSSLPNVALAGIYPRLVQLGERDPAALDGLLGKLFFVATAAAYALVLLAWLAAPTLVPLVFGDRYRDAAPVIVLVCLAFVPVASGSVRACAINIAARSSQHLWSALIGLLVLAPTALCLIPRLHAVGAAIAIAAGSFASAIVSSFLLRGLRECGRQQVLALLLLWPGWFASKRAR